MAGEKKTGWGGRNIFGGLLDELIGTGVQKVFQTARNMAPKCGYCGEPTIIKCQACGRPVCRIHAFVNAQSIERLFVICSGCVAVHFPFVEVSPPGGFSNERQVDQEWQYRETPWDILGVSQSADDEEINDAFRQKAKRVHPDRAKDEHDRRKREAAMKKVAAAKEWMLHHERQV
jgi:hypothetical protein